MSKDIKASLKLKPRARKKFLEEVVFRAVDYRFIVFLDGDANEVMLAVPYWVGEELGNIERIEGIQHGEHFWAVPSETLTWEEFSVCCGDDEFPQILCYHVVVGGFEFDCFLVSIEEALEKGGLLIATIKEVG